MQVEFIDGPMAGTYFADRVASYFCIPNCPRHEFFARSQLAYDSVEWLYYRNTGSSSSKHKTKGVQYKLISREREPAVPTPYNYNNVIVASRAAWRRGEVHLHQNPY